MDRIINLNLLANPANWLTVFAMAALLAMGFLVVYSHANSGGPSPYIAPEN